MAHQSSINSRLLLKYLIGNRNAEDLWRLIWPTQHSYLLSRKRAEVIVSRVNVIASLLGVLTLAWIALDVAVFPWPHSLYLTLARLGTGAALIGIARSHRAPAPSISHAYSRLGMLLIVPAIFSIVSYELLFNTPLNSIAATVATAYLFVPFAVAAGLGIFPLTFAESAAYSLIIFAVEGVVIAVHNEHLLLFTHPGAFWLLFLICTISAFISANQVDLIGALITQVSRDSLTNCYRRESGKVILDMQFRLCVRNQTPLVVFFADIDHFKLINDTYGHHVGDDLLTHVASALKATVRGSDVVIRWGGEEFLVVLPNTTCEDAIALVTRLQSNNLGLRPDNTPLTLSIGLAEYQIDGVDNVNTLIKLADHRMYLAKEAGRNRFVRCGDEKIFRCPPQHLTHQPTRRLSPPQSASASKVAEETVCQQARAPPPMSIPHTHTLIHRFCGLFIT